MGRKRTGKRKHLCGLFAGLIISITFGCVSVPHDRFTAELQNAADLFAQGDFETSLKINQGIVSQCDHKVPCDQALFNIGLIYASENYSRKDYKRSWGMFQRIVREYPQSPLAAQARTWIGVLSVIERSKEADREVEQTRKKLSR